MLSLRHFTAFYGTASSILYRKCSITFFDFYAIHMIGLRQKNLIFVTFAKLLRGDIHKTLCSRAAASKGSITYAFTHMGDFLLLLRNPPPPSLQAHVSAWRPKSHPQGPNLNLKAQIPVSRDLGLKTGIWASRLGYGPPG